MEKKGRVSSLAVLLAAVIGLGCRSSETPEFNPATTDSASSQKIPFGGVKWYAGATDLRGQPHGIFELSEEQAKTLAHYRFTYQEGKVVIVERFRLKGLVNETWQYGKPAANDITVSDQFGPREVYDFDEGSRSYEKILRSGERDNRGCYRLRLRLTLDATGLIERETCLDRKGRERADKRGVAEVGYQRNPDGVVIAETSFGLEGVPVVSASGYQRIEREVDRHGNVLREKYLNSSGQLVVSTETGCAINESEFDDKNLLVATTCYDTGNRSIPDQSGVVRHRYTRNQLGCVGEERYVGVDDQALPIKSGVALLSYEVDEKCALTKVQSFSKDGKQIGPTELNTIADGLRASLKYLDDKGRPAKGGYCNIHEEKYSHDDRGRQVEIRYLDDRGKPAMCLGDPRNWSIEKLDWDERGNVTGFSNLLADGSPKKGSSPFRGVPTWVPTGP